MLAGALALHAALALAAMTLRVGSRFTATVGAIASASGVAEGFGPAPVAMCGPN